MKCDAVCCSVCLAQPAQPYISKSKRLKECVCDRERERKREREREREKEREIEGERERERNERERGGERDGVCESE